MKIFTWALVRSLLGGLLEPNVIAQTFEAANKVSSESGIGELIEIGVTSAVVRHILRKHVIGRHQNLVGHCHGCPLVAASGFEGERRWRTELPPAIGLIMLHCKGLVDLRNLFVGMYINTFHYFCMVICRRYVYRYHP